MKNILIFVVFSLAAPFAFAQGSPEQYCQDMTMLQKQSNRKLFHQLCLDGAYAKLQRKNAQSVVQDPPHIRFATKTRRTFCAAGLRNSRHRADYDHLIDECLYDMHQQGVTDRQLINLTKQQSAASQSHRPRVERSRQRNADYRPRQKSGQCNIRRNARQSERMIDRRHAESDQSTKRVLNLLVGLSDDKSKRAKRNAQIAKEFLEPNAKEWSKRRYEKVRTPNFEIRGSKTASARNCTNQELAAAGFSQRRPFRQ